MTEGHEDSPENTRGKQLQEQFHGNQVAKQVPAGPTTPLWCDGREGRSHGFPCKLVCSPQHFLRAHFLPSVGIQKIWQLPGPAEPVLLAHHVM